ncbi:MAG TPA: carbamate kinase [Myxococcota bacterium]|nr:carbamate kinase [Myxococcota bacterium]
MNLSVVALGGNSLIDPTLPPTVKNQFAVTRRAMRPVARLIADGEALVITHGNGPQVGFMALRSEMSRGKIHEVPLDSLVANTQGSLGYMLQRALREELESRCVDRPIVSVVTEVIVDPTDHAFAEPTKPIGQFHSPEEAAELERERGWTMIDDSHRGWRRVVPSPAPVRILQIDVIRRLARAGTVVICCGGGGIPVVRKPEGHTEGIEGVIDKDRVSALLAVRLGAERLFITTGEDGVYADFLSPQRRFLPELELSELKELAAQGQFPPGSMGPKVRACDRFLTHGGHRAVICRPELLVEAFRGQAGTSITRGP